MSKQSYDLVDHICLTEHQVASQIKFLIIFSQQRVQFSSKVNEGDIPE